MGNIGDVNYNHFKCQTTEVRERTEKSINSLFEKNIINKAQAQKLLSMYLNGEVEFGEDGLNEQEALEFTEENFNNIEQNANSNKLAVRKNTLYIIQPKDTPEVIAEKMGLEGAEAKEFAQNIKNIAKQNGIYFKYGFRVGDIIALPGDFKDKIEALKTEGKYSETTQDINNDYFAARRQKNTPSPSVQDEESQVPPTKDEETPAPHAKDKETPAPPSESRRTPTAPKKPRFGLGDEPPRTEKPAKSNTDKNKTQKIYEEAMDIVRTLGSKPSPKNPVLKKITPQNVTYVMKMYYDINKRHLSRDLLNNGDKNCTFIYNYLCKNLCARAAETKTTGIYYGDAQKGVKNPEVMMKWLNMAYPKMLEAEKKNNAAFNNTSDYNNALKGINYVDTKKVEEDAKKLAKELHGALKDSFEGNSRTKASKIWENKTNGITKSILAKISTTNVAFVVQQYKAMCHTSIAEDVDKEFIGVGINDVKTQICRKLVLQAKKLGINGINENDYKDLDDVNKLSVWIENASNKIINKMKATSLNNDKEVATTERKDNGTTVKTITSGPMFKEAGITKVIEEYNKDGQKTSAKYFYKDGKEVLETYGINEKTKKYGLLERSLIKHGSSYKKTNGTKITEAVPMEIKLPENASEGAKEFAKSLEKNKERLMKSLHIDNDTYNKLARLAMAIAEQETNFDQTDVLSFGTGKKFIERIDTIFGVRDTGVTDNHMYSYGMTQIKYTQWNDPKKEPEVAAMFKALGITSGNDLKYSTEKSALATMVILATINKRVQNQKVQDSIEAANGRVISNEGWEINHQTGKLEKTYNTKQYVNTITDEDAICYYWNNGGAAIRRGTADPAGNPYTNKTRQYIKKYSIKENPEDRQMAISRMKEKQESSAVLKNFKPMDNSGPMGSVIFMPKMYSNKPVNKQDEIQMLKNGLKKNNNISEQDKEAIIKAVQNGELSFEFGIRESEIASLTRSDVNKLLSHLNNLKQTIEKHGRVRFDDGISVQEARIINSDFRTLIRESEFKFKREYLNSRSKTAALCDIPESAVLMSPVYNKMQFSKNAERRGFGGSASSASGIKDKGVNTANTSDVSAALAKSAQRVSNRMNSAGHCLQGVREAVKAAGIDVSDWEEGTPRGSISFFQRHPEMFEEVKFVNIGNGKGRQINSTDLPNLPAGYIVCWVPDRNSEQYKEQPGHISITNGNGQAYADETDNLDWGDYSDGTNMSGKGEHGYFRVFRLTSNWEVKNGKLVFNK